MNIVKIFCVEGTRYTNAPAAKKAARKGDEYGGDYAIVEKFAVLFEGEYYELGVHEPVKVFATADEGRVHQILAKLAPEERAIVEARIR